MRYLRIVLLAMAVIGLAGCGGGGTSEPFNSVGYKDYIIGECTDGSPAYCSGGCDRHGEIVIKYPASYKACRG